MRFEQSRPTQLNLSMTWFRKMEILAQESR